jgi:hypothetical protein
MDRATAIANNRQTLIRIVAALIAMLGMAAGSTVGRIPRPLYRAVSRVLQPAEAAVRRLIVIAAQGLKITPVPVRPLPKGLALPGKRTDSVLFQLFDPRQTFGASRFRRAPGSAEPRIHFFAAEHPLVPLFEAQPVEVPAALPADDGQVNGARLGRRLLAIKLALDDLPHQAKRLVRWQARRERMQHSRFRTPLRPSPPPFRRRTASHDEIDQVLQSCHNLARDVLREDTS